MSDEDINHQHLADAEKLAEAIARGELTVDFNAPTPELPPPPSGEPMVAISARVPVAVYQQLQAEAAHRGVRYGAIVREWLELQSAAKAPDRLIHLSDVLRALSGVREAA